MVIPTKAIAIVVALKGDNNKFSLVEQQLLIIGRAITTERTINKRAKN